MKSYLLLGYDQGINVSRVWRGGRWHLSGVRPRTAAMWGGHPVLLPRTQRGNPCAQSGYSTKRKTLAVRSQHQRLRKANTICSCISRSQTNHQRYQPQVVRWSVEQRDVLTQLQTTWFYSSALNNATSLLGVYRKYPRVRLHHSFR